jgi:hypothetical protein
MLSWSSFWRSTQKGDDAISYVSFEKALQSLDALIFTNDSSDFMLANADLMKRLRSVLREIHQLDV